jgi:hypothetical protein
MAEVNMAVLLAVSFSAFAISGGQARSVSSSSYLIGSFSNAAEVYATDIDSDGDMDVAAVSAIGQIYLWENTDGSGTAWSGRYVGAGPNNFGMVDAIDLDEDGDIDLVSGSKWFENSDGLGETWIDHTICSGYPSSTCLADIDGDSDFDVVLTYLYTTYIYWNENLNGIGTQWASHQITVPPYQDGAQASAGDFDGDGDNDIAVYERDDPLFLRFCWVENTDGVGGSWECHDLEGYGHLCWDLHTADVDQDGDLDLLAACSECGVRLCENLDGTGGTWAYLDVEPPVYCNSREVEFADLDLDGDIDIASTYSYYTNDVAWWENLDGSCDQWLEHGLGTGFPSPDGLHAADMDNDGGVDLVISSSNAIYWIDLYSLGVGDGTAPATLGLLQVTPNPSSGFASVDFEVTEAGLVALSVFDISGRLVQDAGPSEYEPGNHTIQLQHLGSGIYFVMMRALDFTATQRFAVVE